MSKSTAVTAVLGCVVAWSLAACDSPVAPGEVGADQLDWGWSRGNDFAQLVQGGCRGTLTGRTYENVIVPSGAVCLLVGVRVAGNVEVRRGGSLVTESDTRVGGNIQAEKPLRVEVRNSFVRGNIQVVGHVDDVFVAESSVGGDLQFKQGDAVTINDNHVGGDVQLDGNRGGVAIESNRVNGNLQAVANVGGLTINRNRVAENLQCKENHPPPAGANNQASSKEDQCASL